jgi:hypothetical protein
MNPLRILIYFVLLSMLAARHALTRPIATAR